MNRNMTAYLSVELKLLDDKSVLSATARKSVFILMILAVSSSDDDDNEEFAVCSHR